MATSLCRLTVGVGALSTTSQGKATMSPALRWWWFYVYGFVLVGVPRFGLPAVDGAGFRTSTHHPPGGVDMSLSMFGAPVVAFFGSSRWLP